MIIIAYTPHACIFIMQSVAHEHQWNLMDETMHAALNIGLPDARVYTLKQSVVPILYYYALHTYIHT